MIREVIIVEGKSDIARVREAVDADIIATEGYTLRSAVLKEIRYAYDKRGIIILTDPDGPGERIRRRLAAMFPHALHAFVPKEDASTPDDVGIEDALPEAIRKALEKVHPCKALSSGLFTMADLLGAGLSGNEEAAKRRDHLGAILGIGYGNGKQFLRKLNHFGITRKEWEEALQSMRGEDHV